jgi:predicted ATP-dependent endonuclease of OLD family
MTPTGAKISSLSQPTLKKLLAIADGERKNVMLYDAVAKEVFFSKGALFVEGTEDANILRSFLEENQMSEIEIFGYGSGGASNIIDWLTMCDELGIRAFGLYDGDPAGIEHHKVAKERFQQSRAVAVDLLWTNDIRDKPDKLDGIFDANWKIKSDHEARLKILLGLISNHLKPQAPP